MSESIISPLAVYLKNNGEEKMTKLERLAESFKTHKAKIVHDDDKMFIMEWRNKNGGIINMLDRENFDKEMTILKEKLNELGYKRVKITRTVSSSDSSAVAIQLAVMKNFKQKY